MTYRELRFKKLTLLWYTPLRSWARKRLPRHTRGYEYYWTSEAGKEYRRIIVERQGKHGTKPLIDDPTIPELRAALDRYTPKTVLEAGCGWGRLLEELAPYYAIEGCDVSEELLSQVPEHIPTFILDLVRPKPIDRQWDVVFCRAVLMFFIDQPEHMRTAVETLESLARTKVIIWDWPHICEAARPYASDKVEFRYTKLRDE